MKRTLKLQSFIIANTIETENILCYAVYVVS